MMAMMTGYGWSGYGWGGTGYGFMGPGMMGGFGYGWWMPVAGVVFLIVVIVGIYLVFSAYRKSEKPATGSALDIPKERYAKGEITEEQYRRMKNEIS